MEDAEKAKVRGGEVPVVPAPEKNAKYALRDGEALLVASRNWNPGAYPAAQRPGRGM